MAMLACFLVVMATMVSMGDAATEHMRCLSCPSVTSPQQCSTIVTCNWGEVCFTHETMDAYGQWAYRLGCESEDVCKAVPSIHMVGRRQATNPGQQPTCFTCCSSDECNRNLCLGTVNKHPSTEEAQWVCVNTGNNYVYEPVLEMAVTNSSSHLDFNVTACNDAHMAFSATKTDFSHDFYELVIGGWGNTRSVLRYVKQGREYGVYEKPVLNCNTPVTFRLEWDAQTFRLYRQGALIIFHSHDMTFPRYVSVATGWGAKGSWRLKVPYGASPFINEKTENTFSC